MSIKITWLGHACFKLESCGFTVVIDPYTGVPGLGELDLEANMVLCSHGHRDHNYTEAVKIIPSGEPCPFSIAKIDSFHDDKQGAEKGGNIIHMLEYQGVRVAHFGDLGHMPDAEILNRLGPCAAIMVPVGGYYTIDAVTAKKLKDSLPEAVFIPMHFRGEDFGPNVIAPLDSFLALVGDAKHYDENSIEITGNQPPHTAVLGLVRE